MDRKTLIVEEKMARCLPTNFQVSGFPVLYFRGDERNSMGKITIVETGVGNGRFVYHDDSWIKTYGGFIRDYKLGEFTDFTDDGRQKIKIAEGEFQIVPQEQAEKIWADINSCRD
jgi:hypothetical protein